MSTIVEELASMEKFAEVERYKDRAGALVVQDEHSVGLALTFAKDAMNLHDRYEEMRDAEVRPLNTEVKKINDNYRPYTSLLKALKDGVERKVTEYRMKKRRELEEQQRKAIEDARIAKAEAEAEAERLRKEAEEAAKVNVQADTTDEEAALEQIREQKAAAAVADDYDAVVVLEAKEAKLQAALEEAQKPNEVRVVELQEEAQKAELAAALVAPVVIEQQKKTVELPDGGKMGFKSEKLPMLPGGLSLEADYYRDDKRLAMLPDNLFVLDVKRLKKWTKDGQTFPGVEVYEKEAMRRR